MRAGRAKSNGLLAAVLSGSLEAPPVARQWAPGRDCALVATKELSAARQAAASRVVSGCEPVPDWGFRASVRVVGIDLGIWTLHLKDSFERVTCYGPVRASPSGGRSPSYVAAPKALAITPDLLAERVDESHARYNANQFNRSKRPLPVQSLRRFSVPRLTRRCGPLPGVYGMTIDRCLAHLEDGKAVP